jgi:hypothetical protein
MVLSAEALEILTYLKTAHGKYVSILEISKRAGGRRRFEESPNWAKNLMSPMLDAGMIEVNARGHYRIPPSANDQPKAPANPPSPAPRKPKAKIVGDDYFPTATTPRIVGGDYFPD